MPEGERGEIDSADAPSAQSASNGTQQGAKVPKRKEYARIEPPSPEQLVQEDMINNCAVKTVISGIMGSALGICFGVFMGAMDSAVRLFCHVVKTKRSLRSSAGRRGWAMTNIDPIKQRTCSPTEHRTALIEQAWPMCRAQAWTCQAQGQQQPEQKSRRRVRSLSRWQNPLGSAACESPAIHPLLVRGHLHETGHRAKSVCTLAGAKCAQLGLTVRCTSCS